MKTTNKFLLLTQWAPWSWKSTWCENNWLNEYCFNADKYRIVITWYKLNKEWQEVIDNSDNTKIWSFINQELNERLKKWFFTVIDATQTNLQNIQWYYNLARKYWYTLVVKTLDVPLQELLKRNIWRWKLQVPENVIKKMYTWLQEILSSDFFSQPWIIRINELSDLWDIKSILKENEKMNFQDMINKYNVIYWFIDESKINNNFIKRYPRWRKFEVFEEYKNEITINKLKKDPLINISLEKDNIVSFSFKRDAFINKLWNDETIKARWLFVDIKKNKIVARSYNKFFNLNEHEESQLSYIYNNYSWKIDIFVKENWFLWIVWYDWKDVLYCSKSKLTWDFADLVKKHCQKYEKKMLPLLKKWYSFVFEIVDTEKDPHIIDYDTSKNWAYLLDIFKNSFELETFSYDELCSIAKKIWCFVKQRYEQLDSINELTSEKLDWYFNFHWEWFVVSDESWKHFKIKTKYYIFWKILRKILRILNKQHQKNIQENSQFWIKEDHHLFDYCYSEILKTFETFWITPFYSKEKITEIYQKTCDYILEWKYNSKHENVLDLRNYIAKHIDL